jgi:hypothetical protein
MIKDILLSSFFFGIQPSLLALSIKNLNSVELIIAHVILSLLIMLIMLPLNYKNFFNKFKEIKRGMELRFFYGFLSTIITNFFILYDIFAFSKLGRTTFLYVTLYHCFTILFSAFVITKYLNKKINYKSIFSILLVIVGTIGILQV